MDGIKKKNAYVSMHYDEVITYRNALEAIGKYFKDIFGGSFELGEMFSLFTAIKDDCIEHDFLPKDKYLEYCHKLTELDEMASGANKLMRKIEPDFGGFSLLNLTVHGFDMLMSSTYDTYKWLEDALYDSIEGPDWRAVEEAWENLSSEYNTI